MLVLWKYQHVHARVCIISPALPQIKCHVRKNISRTDSSKNAAIMRYLSQGHTGRMSAITVFLKFGGSSMRLFTTLVEIGKDKALLAGYGLGATLNGVLMAQVCACAELD